MRINFDILCFVSKQQSLTTEFALLFPVNNTKTKHAAIQTRAWMGLGLEQSELLASEKTFGVLTNLEHFEDNINRDVSTDSDGGVDELKGSVQKGH